MKSAQTCTICERSPQQLLILVCQHNLCLDCASEIYILNQSANPFVCEICLAETELDQETIVQFQVESERLSERNGNKNKKNQMPPKSKLTQQSPPPNNLPPRPHCTAHRQPSLYYCYSCNSTDICSECILTPKHSNHRVLTLKKAMENWEKRMDEEIQGCFGMKNQLEEQKETYVEGRKETRRLFESKKNQLKVIFDEIARTVSERYAELAATIEEEGSRVQHLYDACLSSISQKQRILEQSIKIKKRAIESKSQTTFAQAITGPGEEKGMFVPNLPKEMPSCHIEVVNSQSLLFDVGQLLARVGLSREFEEEDSEVEGIGNQSGGEELSKPSLKESRRRAANNPPKVQNKLTSSRKLDLSRSIENAAYIINRLQERSAKAT